MRLSNFREFCYDHRLHGKTKIKLLLIDGSRYKAKVLEGGMLGKYKNNIIYVHPDWIRTEKHYENK